MSERRAIVVGAGIAGLATAGALERLGYSVRVLERGSELSGEGAGLTLWPNAVHALRSLGLDGALEEVGHVVPDAVMLTSSGKVITRVPIARIAERFGPLMSVYRPELLRALRAGFGGEIEFETPVSCTDGCLSAAGELLKADLIVGADGIGSPTRGHLLGHIKPRPAGYSSWRGVAETGDLTPTAASETVAAGRRFGLVPLSGRRTYWFAALGAGGENADLDHEFADWHAPIAQVLALTPRATRSYLPLADLPSLARWHDGQNVLVGDAAHAMTPNLGQGAAQALQDVAALIRHLGSDAPQELALERYVRERKRPSERVLLRSRVLGQLMQASNPLVGTARGMAFRFTPEVVTMRQLASVLDG